MTTNKNEIVTIQVSQYLTNEYPAKIAAFWGHPEPAYVNRVREMITDEMQYGGETLEVIAENGGGEVVGMIHCIRSQPDPRLWYYGDLSVRPDCRRRGIAANMVRAAMRRLSEMGAKTLRCYVEDDNEASLALQRSLGFAEKPYETFTCGSGNDLVHADNTRMFERELDSLLTVIPATEDMATACTCLLAQNKDALHVKLDCAADWRTHRDAYRERFAAADPDGACFLICMGAMPVAYLELKGLTGNDTAEIGALFVSSAYHRQGVGSFAMQYAESYLTGRGFSSVGIQTPPDDTAAGSFFKKLGYEEINCNNDEFTYFRKELNK